MSKSLRIILIVGSILAIIFWLIMLFYGFLLGGSPGPGYERTVPLEYAGIFALGLTGAILGVVSGTRGKRTPLAIVAAALGIAGSVPLILLGLWPVGAFAVVISGVLPLLGYVRS